jgi:hypothetical protein
MRERGEVLIGRGLLLANENTKMGHKRGKSGQGADACGKPAAEGGAKISIVKLCEFPYQFGQMHRVGARGKPFLPQSVAYKNHVPTTITNKK